MKISVNAIRAFNADEGCAGDPAPDGVDALVRRIGAQLAAVEEVLAFGEKYAGVVVVKVVECRKHENSDHLSVCTIDDGTITPDVKRDANGYVQVVCGAPNVRSGMTAAWLPPGATVPSSYASEPFVLSALEIRGVLSNGMLASAKELALSDSHDGILEIDEDIPPGTLFAEHYKLAGDAVIDMENKMFTHRPDLFGVLGVARELAGIQGQKFTSPEWYRADAAIAAPQEIIQTVKVRNEIPELVPRFAAVPMTGIKVAASPVRLQVELSRLGLRPINNIVDLTNYYMLLTGQPLHAYDYDKVTALAAGAEQANIVIRKPRAGETLKLLNAKSVMPGGEAIIIAAGEDDGISDKAIGLGGIMGGADTEVDSSTTNIILECASFDMFAIRRTSMETGIFSDAVTRFTKGQSPLQNMAVLARVAAEIAEIAGGRVSGAVADDNHVDTTLADNQSNSLPITVSPQFINDRLGLDLTGDDITALLGNVEFHIHDAAGLLCIQAPFWRTDISIPEDIVEEVGRLYGFDRLPNALPKRDLSPAAKNTRFELNTAVREYLCRAGANEALTYSFVHGGMLKKSGQNPELAYKLSNALSPDLQYYRLSLTPSLLDKIHPNVKAGYDEFALFELGKAHFVGKMDAHEADIPEERSLLSLVYSSARAHEGAPYYQARKFLSGLLEKLQAGLQLRLIPLESTDFPEDPWTAQLLAPFATGRSALILDADGRVRGVVGEYKSAVRRLFKLPEFSAGFEIETELLSAVETRSHYRTQPKYPAVRQDICLRVPSVMPYQRLHDFVQQQSEAARPADSIQTLSPLDIYQREDDPDHKQITFRYSISSYDKTMTDAEVSAVLDKVAAAAAQEFQAERI